MAKSYVDAHRAAAVVTGPGAFDLPAQLKKKLKGKQDAKEKSAWVNYYNVSLGRPTWEDCTVLYSGAAGFDTGKGDKLSNSRTDCKAGVLLSFSPFPVLNPVAPPCCCFVLFNLYHMHG